MTKIVSFSFNRYSLLPIAAGIFYVIRSFSFSLIPNNEYKCSIFFEIVLLEFGMFLSFILELINISRQSNQKKGFKEELKKWIEKYKEVKIILSMLVCGLFDLFGVFLTFLILIKNNVYQHHISSLMRITEFFFVSFMYYIFLKKCLSRHHYVALLFIFAGLFCVFIQGIAYMDYTIIFCIIGNFFYASLEIIYKWLMEYKFISSYELVSISGFFGCFIETIICLILSHKQCVDILPICDSDTNTILNYSKEISNIFNNKYHLIQVGIYVITSLGYNTFHFLTNKHLGPTHRIIGDSVSSIITMTITVIKNNGQYEIGKYVVLQLIGHFLILIGNAMYNEIAIVHLCGLDVNTNKEIKERASKESVIPLLPTKQEKKEDSVFY